MSRRSRWAPVVMVLVGAACGGSSDDVASESDAGPTTVAPTTSGSTPGAPITSTPASTSSSAATSGLGPSPLVPGPGQSWTDLYPDGTPPVFPLPGSARALGSPQAAATAFAQDLMGMDAPTVTVDQQDPQRAALTVQGASAASTRLELRRGELGWEVTGASSDGLDLEVVGATTAGRPTEVGRRIEVAARPAAPAGATVDVIDLADGRLVLRQALADEAGGSAPGATSLTLPDPLPQLAALIFYVPDGPPPASGDTALRRASAASVSPVHVRPS